MEEASSSAMVLPEVMRNDKKMGVNGIRGFYTKIHEEITQLKHILIDEMPENEKSSPVSP